MTRQGPRRTTPALGAAPALIALALVVCSAVARAQDDGAAETPRRAGRLFEQAPFDQVVLKEPAGEIVRIEPLPLRTLPTSPAPTQKLVVRLLNDPDTDYEIFWRDIERVDLFEQMILQEARDLAGAGKFDEAFDGFRYLRRNYSALPGLEPAMQDYLAAEAENCLAADQFERGYALLLELDARNHDHPRLGPAYGRVMDKLIGDYVRAKNLTSARGLLARFAARFAEHPVAVHWKQELGDEAAATAAQSEQALAAGQPREAYELARRAVEIWPQQPEARTAMERAHAAYPAVTVGVIDPIVPAAAQAGPVASFPEVTPTTKLEDWATRRVARLTSRPLFELIGVGAQGGQYASPWGDAERTELGRMLGIRLRASDTWSDAQPMTAPQVARFLLALADPHDPRYDPVWHEVLGQIEVDGGMQLDVSLRRAHLLVEALLTAPMARHAALRDVPTGPFITLHQAGPEVTYAVPQQNATGENRPREIVERAFAKSEEAIDALLRGEIAVLDRVNPWDLATLAEHTEVTVAPYAWPTVHCLVPNVTRPLPANRTFRRALIYVLNRESILRQRLLRGRDAPGSMVASGPFARGASFDDPRGYANDDQLAPRSTDPHLALTLAAVALAQVHPKAPAATAQTHAETPSTAEATAPADAEAAPAEVAPPAAPAKPKLVLAHPPTEVARVACDNIARYIALLGVDVELREVPRGGELGDDWDLRYCELAACEPLVDAWRLFGPGGLAAGASPYMELALRELAVAEDWPTARRLLLEIHRRVHDDVAIVPLWQLNNYCAWHQRLTGVGQQPVTLYQNLEQWRVSPWFPVDAY